MLFSARTGGFYDPTIHGENVPEDAVEITALQHADLLGAQSKGARIEGGPEGLPVATFPAPPSPDESLKAARALGRTMMQAWIDGFLAPFTAGRPRDEIASWPAKAAAAESHLAGKPHAMILAEAAVTGENPDDLALSIAIKAQAYMVIAAKVAGLRRATEGAINAATSQDEISAALDAAKAAAVAEMAAVTAKPEA